jgi:AhpD family alkylhydroperoxidase
MLQTPRMTSEQFNALVPGASKANTALGNSAEVGALGKVLSEMVRLRCSQINGCAYCVQYHTDLLLEAGVSAGRITLIPVWEEAGIFSEREQAAFVWAEELTRLADTHASDAAWERVSAHFSSLEVAALTTVIAAINVWNRIAVSMRYAVDVPA